jgi:hypothetical protein
MRHYPSMADGTYSKEHSGQRVNPEQRAKMDQEYFLLPIAGGPHVMDQEVGFLSVKGEHDRFYPPRR